MAISGSGTSSDPYIISTAADLSLLSGTGIATYGLDKYYELGADITFTGTANFTPIGNSSNIFSGSFDGKNHTITGMNIQTSSDCCAMFCCVTGAVQIKNILFKDCIVNGINNNYYGMLIGYVQGCSGANISNIETDGCFIECLYYGGGLVGFASNVNTGDMEYSNCYVHDGNVISGTVAGGFAGYGVVYCTDCTTTFSNCIVEREVINSSSDVGGFIGKGAVSSSGTNAVYNNCKVLSCVMTASYSVGGFAGDSGVSGGTYTCNSCIVDNSYIIGKSSINGYVGGFIGANSGTDAIIDACGVTNCTIIGCAAIGGIVGYSQDSATITDPTISHNNINSTSGNACGGVYGDKYTTPTVTGGVQDYNNIVGTGGGNCATITNQTSVADQYITAESLSAVVGSDNKTVTFTVTGQRGAGISYDSTTNLIDGGMNWQYTYPSSSAEEVNFSLTKEYTKGGTFTPKLHLYNPGNTAGVWLTANQIVVVVPLSISVHDMSLRDKSAEWCQSMPAITNHDMSILR